MKIALLALALPLIGCGMVDVVSKVSSGSSTTVVGGGPTAKGIGRAVAETRQTEAATSAEFDGPFKVEIRRGGPALVVEAQKEILPHLKTECKGGRLRVWLDGNVATTEAMRVTFTAPSLGDVKAGRAATVGVTGFSGGIVTIILDGASRIDAQGKADGLKLTLSGASTASLAGLDVKRAEVHLDGASTADLQVTGSLTGEASSASTVNYSGKPGTVDVKATGASSVNAK